MPNFIKSYVTITVFNLLFRGLSMASRFIVVIYLGKYFSTDLLGIYSLFVATSALLKFIIGYEFYSFNTRELLAVPQNQTAHLIRDHFVATLLFYCISLPIIYGVFYTGVLDMKYYLIFILILLVDYIASEFARIFAVLSHPVMCNFLLFMITGGWILPVIGIWFWGNNTTFDLLWYSWLISGSVSICISLIYFKRINVGTVRHKPIDWQWIKRGLNINTTFFLGSIAYRVIEVSGRYFLEHYNTTSSVGVFSFFYGIASTIFTLVFTIVILIISPKLIKNFEMKNYKSYYSLKKRFTLSIICFSLFFGLCAILFIKPVLVFMNKEEFFHELSVFYYLVIGVIIFCLTQIPYYVLYLQRKDKVLMLGSFLGLLFNLGFSYIFIPQYGIYGAAITYMLSIFIILLFLSYYAYRKYPINTARYPL